MTGPMETMKYSVWILWIGSLAAIFYNGSTVGHLVFWGTLVAHLVEFMMKRRLFEKVGGSMQTHFIQTMIYGLFYWHPLERDLQN